MSSTTRNGRSGSPPRGDLFEELWGQIEAMVSERLADALPTMGTVVGRDGGAIKVRLDEEGVDRKVGFPRAKGASLSAGDRVPVHKTRGGDRFIGAPTDSRQDEAVVDSPQVRGKAIKNAHIDSGAVQRNNIGNQAVGGNELDNTIMSKINDAATSSQLKNVEDRASDARSEASDAKRDASEAQKAANDAQSAANSLKSQIAKLDKRLDKLEKKK